MPRYRLLNIAARGKTPRAASDIYYLTKAVFNTMTPDEKLSAADEALSCALGALDDEALPIENRLELFRRAAKLLDDSKSELVKRAAAWNGIGVCLYRTQAGTKAEEEAFSHSLNLLRRSPEGAHGEFAASVLSNLGECCLRAGKRERAHELYGQALDELRPTLSSPGCSERYAICACARAQCADDEDALDEIITHTRIVKRAHRDEAYYRALGLLSSIEGALLCRREKPRRGIRRLVRAAHLYTLSGAEPAELSEIHSHIAKAYIACGRIEDAGEQLELSLELLLAGFPTPGDALSFELGGRLFTLAQINEQLGNLETAAKYFAYSANFFSCCRTEYISGEHIGGHEALSHYLSAACLCRMPFPLYYDAMRHYDLALRALDRCPEESAAAHRRLVLSARADIYEAFGETQLAAADYTA